MELRERECHRREKVELAIKSEIALLLTENCILQTLLTEILFIVLSHSIET